MVQQLRKQGITNERVLAAMAKVPRHLFVDEGDRGKAYAEAEIPLGSGQVMCSPYAAALMAQVLDPRPGTRVFHVGTGSGYLAAVLAEITPQVYTMDMRAEIAQQAQLRLRSLGYSSVRCRTGPACQGWPSLASFDAIVVTCAAERVPEALIAQLRDGGRLVIPIGHGPEQTLNCLRKSTSETGPRLKCLTIAARIHVAPMVCQRSR
jgi:protein-L-isoaspartate(D-aspartate) O-methyltransferase